MTQALSSTAQAFAARITERWRASVESIIEAGRLLIEAKEQLAHGEFGAMIEQKLPFSASTAQRLMAIARDQRLSNPAHVQHLPASWGTLYELTTLSDDEFQRALAHDRIRPDLQRAEVVTLKDEPPVREAPAAATEPAGGAAPAITADPATAAAVIAQLSKDEQVRLLQEAAPDAVREAAKELNARRAEEGRNARRELAIALSNASVELTGERKYPAGYFDFPWKRKQGVTDRSYENHYPTMTWAEIIEWCLKWRDRFLDNAWFYIWIPRAHAFALHPVTYKVDIGGGEVVEVDIPTPLAWAVARALGATAYSTAFNWTKTDEEFPDDIGSGILVRDQDEWLLMFKKGNGLPKPASHEIVGSNHRERSKPLGHSRKPQHYREMIARMVGPGVPVLECFARHDENFPLPEGWDSWGNQAQPAPNSEAAE